MKRLLLAAILAVICTNSALAYNIPPFATDNEVLQATNGNNNNTPPPNGQCRTGSPVDVATGDFIQTLPILTRI